MLHHASNWFLLFVFAATAHVQAQALPSFALETTIPWNTSLFGPAGTVIRCVSGEMNGDGRADCFAVAGASGTDILFCSGPSQGAACVKLAQHANDVAIATGAGPNGTDALVAVDADGLRRIWFDATNSPPFSTTMLVVGGAWSNASVLRCANINGTGGLDYVAVAADRHTVIYRRDTGGGIVETSFHVTAAVLDLEPLRWAAGSVQSLALLTSSGVEIRAADTGALIDTFTTSSGAAIAVMRVGANGPDRLNFVIRVPGSSDVLQVLRRQGPKIEATLSLPRSDCHSMVTSDADADGDQDLVISFTPVTSLLYLANLGVGSGVYAVSPTTSAVITDPCLTTAAPGAHAAAPVLRDFDGDGYPDLFLPTSDISQEVSSFRLLTRTPGEGLTSADLFQGTPSPQLSPVGDGHRLRFAMAFDLIPAAATHLEVTVWHSPDALTLDKNGLERYLQPVAGLPVAMTAANVDIHDSSECITGVKFVDVRLVQLANNTITRAWPTYTFALASSSMAYTLVQNFTDLHFPVVRSNGTGIACSTIGSWPCSVIPRKRKLDPTPGSITQPANVNTTSPITLTPTP